MNTFTADLHLHTDGRFNGHAQHGEEPKKMAEAIHRSGINAFAITEHHRPNIERFQETRARVEELQRQLKNKTTAFLGVELSLASENKRLHVGYIFDDQNMTHAPDVPDQYAPISDLATLKKEAPGVAILNHPTWKDETEEDMLATNDIILANVQHLDGLEFVNYLWMNGKYNQPERSVLNMRLADRVQQSSILAMIGSSDAHRAEHVAQCTTAYIADSPHQLLDAIRQRRTAPIIAGANGKLRNGLIRVVRQFKLFRSGKSLGMNRNQVHDSTPQFIRERRELHDRRYGRRFS